MGSTAPLFLMTKINNVILDHTIEFTPAPEPQAEFSLSATSYSGDENTVITFRINRTVRTDQVCDIDWAVTNATVTPTSGTQRFQIGESFVDINVTAGEVDTDELGDIDLSNPVRISGPSANPVLGNPFTATFEVLDTTQSIFNDVTYPPFIMSGNNLYTITTKDFLDNGTLPWRPLPIKEWDDGISNSPDGFHYKLRGDGRDLKIDLSGEPVGTWLQHPIFLEDWGDVKLIGCRWEPAVREYTMQAPYNGEYATNDYPYPKYPWTMVVRCEILGQFWMEGCVIDLAHSKNYFGINDPDNPDQGNWEGILAFNSDYTVWRAPGKIASIDRDGENQVDGYGYLDSKVWFVNCVFKGVQGSPPGPAGDTMSHADFMQNQGASADSPPRYSQIIVENCVLRNGQEGFVLHEGRNQIVTGQGYPQDIHRTFLKMRNVDFSIGGEFRGPFRWAAGGTGAFATQAWQSNDSYGGSIDDGLFESIFVTPFLENIWYTSWSSGDGTPFVGVIKVDTTGSGGVWLGDPKHDALNSVIGHPAITEYPWVDGGQAQATIDNAGMPNVDGVGLGAGYISPWASYHSQDS